MWVFKRRWTALFFTINQQLYRIIALFSLEEVIQTGCCCWCCRNDERVSQKCTAALSQCLLHAGHDLLKINALPMEDFCLFFFPPRPKKKSRRTQRQSTSCLLCKHLRENIWVWIQRSCCHIKWTLDADKRGRLFRAYESCCLGRWGGWEAKCPPCL